MHFYIKNCTVGFLEEWSSLANAIAQCLLYPFFVWMFAKLWYSLNEAQSAFTLSELFIYLGLTEIIFLTTLRGPLVDEAVFGFETTLTKPRIWLLYVSSLIFGRQLGRRLVLLLIFLLLLPILSGNLRLSLISASRFLLILPLLCIIETIYSSIFVCLQICFFEIKYFRLAFTKIILVFGGVFTPLNELTYSWKKILINSPISDIVFQPCYYCLKGQFYQITTEYWLVRISIQIIISFILLQLLYLHTRWHFRCYGG